MLFYHSFPLCVQTCSWGRKCDLHNVYQFRRRCLARGCAHTSGLGPSMAGTGSILCIYVCVWRHTRLCFTATLLLHCVMCVLVWPANCVDVYVCACLCLTIHTGFCFTAALLLHCVQMWPVSCECVCVCAFECVSHQSVGFCYTAAFLLHCAQMWPVMLCLYVYTHVYVCKSVCVSHHSVGFCVPLQCSCSAVCRCGQWAVCLVLSVATTWVFCCRPSTFPSSTGSSTRPSSHRLLQCLCVCGWVCRVCYMGLTGSVACMCVGLCAPS